MSREQFVILCCVEAAVCAADSMFCEGDGQPQSSAAEMDAVADALAGKLSPGMLENGIALLERALRRHPRA